jgi:hypothetical protein
MQISVKRRMALHSRIGMVEDVKAMLARNTVNSPGATNRAPEFNIMLVTVVQTNCMQGKFASHSTGESALAATP